MNLGAERPGRSPSLARVFMSALLLGFVAGAAWADGPPQLAPISGRYYTLEAVRSSLAPNTIRITLRSLGDFYLNGKGYPPLTIELRSASLATPGTQRLETEGVDRNGLVSWSVLLQEDQEDPIRLIGRIYAIVCGESLCQPIADDVELEIRP
ncbi:MAG: hypothetical protein KKA67_07785 [Spirochaetes bacterium]|nr:hypothetical protein [Spirochaetota bacterium]